MRFPKDASPRLEGTSRVQHGTASKDKTMTDYDIDKHGNPFKFDKSGRYFKKDIQTLTPHQLIHCQLFGFEVAEFGSTGAEDEVMRRLIEHESLEADRKRYGWWKMHPHHIVANVDMEKRPWKLTFSALYLNGVFDTVDEAIDEAMKELEGETIE